MVVVNELCIAIKAIITAAAETMFVVDDFFGAFFLSKLNARSVF
jgi:hypothetical protein